MPTARERAREAAQRRAGGLAIQGSATTAVDLAAHAASDVWEPIVRELIGVVVDLSAQQAMPDDWYESVLARTKEALGE